MRGDKEKLQGLSGKNADDVRQVLAVVAAITGHDFSAYKPDTVARRINRRVAATSVGGIRDYFDFLKKNPEEAYVLQQELLIGVTGFFRDPRAFETLRDLVLPELFAGRSEQEPIRIWHPCCSTGEEAYSLAILIAEYLQETGSSVPVQIFATDLDDRAISHARAGKYGPATADALTPDRLQRFFTQVSPDEFNVDRRLRKQIVFAQHNVLQDPPFSSLDLIVCRNFLIYLIPELQKKVFSLFHVGLNHGGYLFLGLSESLPHDNDYFSVVSKKWKIFRRSRTGHQPVGARLPFTLSPTLTLPRPQAQQGKEHKQHAVAVNRILLERFAPPAVIVNERFEVVHIPTRHGGFLNIPAGEPTRDICALVIEELRPALRAALHKVFSDRECVVFRHLPAFLRGVSLSVTLTVEPIDDDSSTCALILFEENEVSPGEVELPAIDNEDSKDSLIVSLEQQLRATREQLNATIEQLQTSNEGLMSTNEELVSINEEFHSSTEELQAANEELETSREEMQTLNEELSTVNQNLEKARAEAVAERNLLKAVMDALPVGVAIVDKNGGIIEVNSMYHQVWGGEPPATSSVDDYDMYRAWWAGTSKPVEPEEWASAKAVMAGETVVGQYIEIEGFDGKRRFVYNSAAPFHDSTGRIGGSAVAIMDVTPLKQAEEQLAHRHALLEGVNRVLAAALGSNSDEEFGLACLRVVEEVTGSQFGFVGEIGADGLLHATAVSTPGWELCSIVDNEGKRRPPENFRTHGLYGKVLADGKAFYTNCPSAHPKKVGFPAGHPPIHSFLGVPLLLQGKVTGMIGLGNKTGGYSAEDQEALEMLAPVIVQGFMRKRGEEEVRRSEERYRTLFTNMTEGFALGEPIIDACGVPQDFRFIEINDGFEKQSGLTREMLGRPMMEVLPFMERFWIDTYCGVAISGIPIRFENYNRDLDKHFDVFCYSPGKGTFAILFRDITDRKNAEESVRKAYDRVEKLVQERTFEVEQKEALLRTVLETLPVGVAVIGDDGRVSYLNPAFTKIWGAPGGDGTDYLTYRMWRTGTEEPVPIEENPVAVAFSHRESVLGQIVDIIGADGIRRVILVSAAPICLGTQEKAGVVTVIEDITEQQELQKQLLHVQKLDSIGSLAGGIAHDFNNILMVILGFAEEVRAGLQDEQLREAQDIVLSSAEKARVLTHKILAFSRQQMAQMSPVDLDLLVDGVATFIRRIIPENISISAAHSSSCLNVMADSTQVEQVLTNIIINARDAMPNGGSILITSREAVISVNEANRLALQPGRYAAVSVSDTGSGIPSDNVTRIFEPFFTTKEIGKGTGLGLSIAYGVMRKHGGTISVRSVIGEGTTFTIFLPLHDGKSAVQADQRVVANLAGSGRILIVEDDSAVRLYLRTLLARAGYSVEEAANGIEGVEAAQKREFDMVVSDVIMPEMNGMEMYRTMKSINPRLKFIFMSGYSSDIVSPAGLDEKEMHFIQKPVSRSDLLYEVRRVLEA